MDLYDLIIKNNCVSKTKKEDQLYDPNNLSKLLLESEGKYYSLSIGHKHADCETCKLFGKCTRDFKYSLISKNGIEYMFNNCMKIKLEICNDLELIESCKSNDFIVELNEYKGIEDNWEIKNLMNEDDIRSIRINNIKTINNLNDCLLVLGNKFYYLDQASVEDNEYYLINSNLKCGSAINLNTKLVECDDTDLIMEKITEQKILRLYKRK